MAQTLVDTGIWTWGDEGVRWELHRATALPQPEHCTAVFCVAVTPEDAIVLEREARGWGMIGGHIDDGETIEQALVRECLEESGYTIKKPDLFGYRKIVAASPVTHPVPGKAYPFPVSYIAYYMASCSKTHQGPSDPEVLETGTFSLAEIRCMGIPDFSTIELGWEIYQRQTMTV